MLFLPVLVIGLILVLLAQSKPSGKDKSKPSGNMRGRRKENRRQSDR